jgi:hypothetical protein
MMELKERCQSCGFAPEVAEQMSWDVIPTLERWRAA